MAQTQGRRSNQDLRQMEYFIAAIGGLAGLCILINISRRWMGSGKKRVMPSGVLPFLRFVQGTLLRKAPLFPSAGHALLGLCYAVVNMVLLLTNTDGGSMSQTFNTGSRAGWLAVGNLVLVVFLSLRNTPLALFTSWSFERLNFMHRAAGCMTIVAVIVHASCHIADYAERGRLYRLATREKVYGEVAALAMLSTGAVAILLRRRWYELFFLLHISLWMLVVVMVCLHQPDIGDKVLIVMFVAVGMWLLDRLIRAARLLVFGVNNSVTLTALPKGATRVTLNKGPWNVVPGEACFLYIPRIRRFQTHPFTLSSTGPCEFVISAQSGFTRDLHQYALNNPGATLAASVEGSYGAVRPTIKDFDTVLLIAGGSGATFAFGTALHMLKTAPVDEKKQLIFVWIVKYEEQLSWFEAQLDMLRRDERVLLQLHVTRAPEKSTSPPGTPLSLSEEGHPDAERPWILSGSASSCCPESTAYADGASVQYERPDVPRLVRAAVDGTRRDGRILVMGCGPLGLLEEVRNTTAACVRPEGPGIELDSQQFSL